MSLCRIIEFNEAADPVHRASLIALGLVLFVLTFVVLAASRVGARGAGVRAVGQARAFHQNQIMSLSCGRSMPNAQCTMPNAQRECMGCGNSFGP